ncbi:uncharacterized protein LOC127254186 [Andrographis paniculata]|uniref:uncharacterized protein LOC127254186 n=1 Tax=Andrographis paniculata TaxID=175694 RepID=UPI0021E88E23|nr:uncharacterized protein LOC127254186 [Andrographis paniculata]
MTIIQGDSHCGDEPTLDEIKHEISSIVGLSDVKKQLESVVDKIIKAKKDASEGLRVVPPKPFHLVFIGNSGTGKSMVAGILAKLFYLAGALSSYTVTEMQGSRQMKDAGRGVLVVNIDEDPIKLETFKEIIDVMDEGHIVVIFSGNLNALNQCMKLNNEFYYRLSACLQFNDLTPLELATILQRKASEKGENDLICGLELDSSCITCDIAQIIADVTPENLRRQLNAHLIDQMLIEAMKVADSQGEKTISLRDLGIVFAQNGVSAENPLFLLSSSHMLKEKFQ